MIITAGSRLGPYEILALLGRGGMGQVYRARDSRLGRTVAIKLLPRETAGDSDARARLLREARAISALDHPHICALYDVGHESGLDFLVMQYLAGETLVERLQRGALPLQDAVAFGIQMADALDAAHRHGIVHRDLKPANVMVTESGIRLLDFGIAKVQTAAVDATASAVLTAPGLILGTPGYMSPEQLDGREADPRSDIFAMGAVLYELLTGRRAFDGDGPAGIVSAIMTRDAPPVSALQPLAPHALDHVVSKCLAKRPDDRWQTARDVASELAFAASRPASPGGDAPRAATPRWHRAGVTIGVTAAAVLSIVAVEQYRGSQRREDGSGVKRVQFEVTLPAAIRAIDALAVSRDGSQVLFHGDHQLWVHDLRTGATRAIRGIAGEPRHPFWSDDGERVAYFQKGKLFSIPAQGGIPQPICDATDPRGGSWGAHDTIVFSDRGSIFTVPANGGNPLRVPTSDEQTGYRYPHFLSDGQHFVYVTGTTPTTVFLGSLDPDEPHRPIATLVRESEAYAASGFLLTAVDFTLRAQRFDVGDSQAMRAEVPLARHIAWPPGFGHARRTFALASDVLVYSTEQVRRFQFSRTDRAGRPLASIGRPVPVDAQWSLSPNGRTIAYSEWQTEARTRRISLMDVESGRTQPFTSERGDDYHPVWARSGDQIVFTRTTRPTQQDPGFSQDLHLQRLGSDSATRIGESSPADKLAGNWHADGRTLLYTQSGFWHVQTGSAAPPVRWFESPGHLDGQFSPDGRWVAYVSNESGSPAVYVRRFPEADGKTQISTATGVMPRWRPDGRALFYIEGNSLMEVELQAGSMIEPGQPRRLFDLGDHDGYAVLRDGDGFVLCRAADPFVRPTITVVLNWATELLSKGTSGSAAEPGGAARD